MLSVERFSFLSFPPVLTLRVRPVLLRRMIWTEEKILKELRRLRKNGANLSYNALSRTNQALVSAAAYHFGTYRDAVARAGIEYAEVLRRPRWTKKIIISLIKKGRREGADLNWGNVTVAGGGSAFLHELSRAAFAAIQPRLFGSWAKALVAAGLDVDEVSRYRKWDKAEIVYELRSRHREGGAMNSGAIQKEMPDLHAAAVRTFGGHDAALAAAGLNAAAARMRRKWTRGEVLAAIKKAAGAKKMISDTVARRKESALYGAATRMFGSFAAARSAAGVKGPGSKKTGK